jgi:hypothetical protein
MSDIEREVTAFEDELAAIRARSRACVERFRAVEDENLQYLFAERLGQLGSVIVSDLYALVLDDPAASAGLQYLAAWVAVRVGDRGPAVDRLCHEVTSGSPYALPAANALARFGLVEGLGPMTTALEAVDPDNVTSVFEWAMALHDLGGELPAEVRRELEQRTSHSAARAVLTAFSRPSPIPRAAPRAWWKDARLHPPGTGGPVRLVQQQGWNGGDLGGELEP